MLVPELAVEEESLYECLMRHASLDRILSFVKYVSTQTLPASIVENLARYLIRLGHARELWNIGHIPRVFFVQPFIERLSQAEGSEETQWLVERLLEIDSAVVLKDSSLRQLAFQFASSELLLRSVNQVVASEAEDATVREIFGELEEYLTQRASVDRLLDVVRQLSEGALPAPMVERLARRLCQLGHAKELWGCWRISRQFLVQPFIERSLQAESSEETQWLIERLLEIDSAVVLKDSSLRQLAFQFASSELLLRSVNQVVASEAEDATVREIFGELEEYLTQRASVDRLLDVVRQLSEGALPAPMVERLARRLCQLGHAKELWGCWRISRQFLVQPFIERSLQAESSEETQWLIERLLEIDSAVVLKDSSLRQLAFQFASSEQLLRCINQVAGIETETSTIREILGKLERYLSQRFENQLSRAWEFLTNVEKFVERRGLLWHVATEQVKLKALKRYYQKFFDILDKCEKLIYDTETIYQTATQIAVGFTEEDMLWIEQFTSISDCRKHPALDILTRSLNGRLRKDHPVLYDCIKNCRKYYVARAAEKAVMKYYRKMGYEVEDISILPVTQRGKQVTGAEMQSDDRWKFADIELSNLCSKLYVDVKSSTLEDRMYYRSQFVKEFRDVGGQGILYTGVVFVPHRNTSYDELEEDDNFFSSFAVSTKRIRTPMFVVIGETRLDVLLSLKQFCDKNGLSFVLTRGYESGNYLPAYLFDYGKDFYKDKSDIIERIGTLEDSEVPSWEEAELISRFYKTSLIAVFLMARCQPPKEWMMSMEEWQRWLVDIILSIPDNVDFLYLPFLFFSLLIHCIKCITFGEEAEGYSPDKYSSFLRVGKYTLGVLDPLLILDSFTKMILHPLWNKRSQIQDFKQFRLVGPQLLQATSSIVNGEWITLVAWCENCGYFPLVFGENPNCPACGRLICTRIITRFRWDRLQKSWEAYDETCYTCSKKCKLNELSPEEREKQLRSS
jgi:hypothetical protein